MDEEPIDRPCQGSFEPFGLDLAVRLRRHIYVPQYADSATRNYEMHGDTVVNPIGLKGQIHGGVAQGLGQALMERVVYDRESGQNLTGSFMDHWVPRADTMPYMEITSNPVAPKRNPLGAKGAGEAGTVGALPAIVNPVVDALAPLGPKV